jgi:hypothetical protein
MAKNMRKVNTNRDSVKRKQRTKRVTGGRRTKKGTIFWTGFKVFLLWQES